MLTCPRVAVGCLQPGASVAPVVSQPMPPLLVASDLDGTLLRSDDTVSPRTRAAVNDLVARGGTFVYATGRPIRWIQPVADVIGHHGLAVASNGALVIDLASGEVLHETLLQPDDAAETVDRLMAAVPSITFAVDGNNFFGHDPGYRPRWPSPPGTVVAPIEELVRVPFIKMLVREETMSGDTLLALCQSLVGDIALPTRSSSDGLIEITAFGTGKAEALNWIITRQGLAASDVVAFGDMPNDLDMLRWAGHGVAVANAHEDVLSVADEITASNDDDGVARVMERYLL